MSIEGTGILRTTPGPIRVQYHFTPTANGWTGTVGAADGSVQFKNEFFHLTLEDGMTWTLQHYNGEWDKVADRP
jgi:hypothetical protein